MWLILLFCCYLFAFGFCGVVVGVSVFWVGLWFSCLCLGSVVVMPCWGLCGL